ncbi:MAG: C4-type zinc ribbon domain-containing protein [Verrucomicrobiota bacterium]
MLEILEKLLIVQDRDRRLAQLTAEATRIPTEVAAMQNSVAAEAAKLESAKTELKLIETERKKLEIDADSKRQQILKYRTQLNLIKSNTEYQALLKEIGKAEADIRQIEDVEIEFMEKIDKLQPALKAEQVQLKEITAKGEVEKSELQKRVKLIETEQAQIKVERDQLATAIDPDILSRYERLLRSKGDVAIVPVKHGNCGGCHLNVPPQIIHNAKLGTDLVSCNYCSRILYWQSE